MEHRILKAKKVFLTILTVIILCTVLFGLVAFSTLFGIFAEVQDYDEFSESRQELLEEYYELDLPATVEYVKFHYDHYRDTNAVLILKCSHKRFDEFMQLIIDKPDCSYSTSIGTVGQYGTYDKIELRYESADLKTTVSYGTVDETEYIELYSTHIFQKYKEFKKA